MSERLALALGGAPLSAATRSFLAASALSSLGNGLTFPVGALYLVRVRGLPLDSASLFYICMAGAGSIAALACGPIIDRTGPQRLVWLSLLAEALGLCAFALAGNLVSVAAAGLLIGAGNGVFFTGLTSLLARLASGPTLDSVFSLRYWLINLGNSTGALIGGGIVSVAGERALTPMYLANAATSVVLAVVACALPLERGAAPGVDSAMPERSLAWTPNLISLVAAHTLLVLFGFAAFEAVVPFAFVGTRGTPIALAHLIVAASTLAILGAQIPISRWGRSWPKAQLLQLQALLWALAALLGWSAAGASPAATWLIALAYGALFGVGECLFAAGLQSLVVRSVERDQLGRFNGVLAASYSGSLAIGPALGFGLIGRGSTASFWLAVGGAMLLAFALWSHAARHEARTL